MSDPFQRYEDALERKLVMEQDEEFRLRSRRDKLFGQWAGRKLGYSAAALEPYATAVVDTNFEKLGDDDMLGKVTADFSFGNVVLADDELIRALRECYAIAAQQIAAEKNKPAP